MRKQYSLAFQIASLLSCLLVAGLATRSVAAGPNVVFFLVDDLGSADCGFSGGTQIKTPRIDKLAAEGCRLNAFYVQPVCSPTRAALMTGRYPMRLGLQVGVIRPWANYGMPLGETTLADDLHAAGYATGIFGKWHLGHVAPEYLPLARGFDTHVGHYNGALDYFTHIRDGGLDWHRDGKPLREEGYSTDLVAQHASEFVSEHAGQRPFFLYVPFNGVHSPYQPPLGGADAYPQLKGVRKNYAAMLTSVDQAIGQVVDAIDKAGVRGETLFIFSSDNGGPSPGRITDNGDLRAGKGTVYEGGTRVAAFATWEEHIQPGSSSDEPLHIVDWRPTLQRLCSADSTTKLPLDGRNAWLTIAEGKPSPHESILLNTTPEGGAVRVGDWKLVAKQNRRGAETYELYNLKADRSEKQNLADTENAKLAELKAVLQKFADEAVPPKSEDKAPDFKSPAVWGDVAG